MNKIISMTDFVLEQSNNALLEDCHQANKTYVNKVINYANFLTQDLTLGLFVPCDEKGNVLEEKTPFQDKYYEYQQAQEKVIFKGCKAEKKADFYIITDSNDSNVWVSWNTSKRIEDLIPYNLTLCKPKTN